MGTNGRGFVVEWFETGGGNTAWMEMVCHAFWFWLEGVFSPLLLQQDAKWLGKITGWQQQG